MNLTPIHHVPTEEEISSRISKVQERMSAENLDWYVSFCPDNIFYLTNFANFVHERPFVLLIPVKGTIKFLVPLLEIPNVKNRSVGHIDLIDYFEFPAPEGENWFDKLGAVLENTSRVGVESICPLQIYEAIDAARIRSDIIDQERQIKSPYEIGRLAYAGQVASRAMEDLLENAKVGSSLQQVSSRGKEIMFSQLWKDEPLLNPQALRLTTVFQNADYSHDPHNFSDLGMQMKEGGPHVSVINAVLNGYGTEIERTFFLGYVPDAARKPYEVMMRARQLTFDLVVPGARMCDVDKAVNDLFKREGYEDYLLHRAGHGMGVTAHEGPFLAEGDHGIIEKGMSFTVEPGIYIPGVGGFRHSDTIIVTDNGNISLTNAPDSLEDMTL